jgi:hypothetical protein
VDEGGDVCEGRRERKKGDRGLSEGTFQAHRKSEEERTLQSATNQGTRRDMTTLFPHRIVLSCLELALSFLIRASQGQEKKSR